MKKDVVEEFYGIGTRIKITNMTYSIGTKSIVIESTIKLGNIITEEVLDSTLLEVLIQDVIQHIHPNSNISLKVSWDS
jgi:hypothetical protein